MALKISLRRTCFSHLHLVFYPLKNYMKCFVTIKLYLANCCLLPQLLLPATLNDSCLPYFLALGKDVGRCLQCFMWE